MKHKVAELTGGELDAAVAACGEWETAHRYYPTMTLDPTFSGWYLTECSGEMVCYLRPRNPMRQDPQPFPVSSDWAFGGPIIGRERIALLPPNKGDRTWWTAGLDPTVDEGAQCESGWIDLPAICLEHEQLGPTPLIAAMRAYVASKFGEEIDLP